MQLIVPSYQIISYPKNVLQTIEKIARTCYKSEDKITEESANNFVSRLLNNGHMPMIEFGGDIVVKFISNRGFSHEMTRHRLCSFAQESSRYCNYSKNKFGGDVTFCELEIFDSKLKKFSYDKVLEIKELMVQSWLVSEIAYMELVNLGVPPDVAREVLPIGIKTEIVVKANPVEWRHIFKLRCSKKAHPRMRELMIPLREELKTLVPILFDDIE